MINSSILLKDLKQQVTLLEDDIRNRCKAEPEVNAPLQEAYDMAKKQERTAFTYNVWLDDEITQIAVAWVLGCVFVRFLEDNDLVSTPNLAGPDDKLQRARDEHEHYFRNHPTGTDRDYLQSVFTEYGQLPAMKEFFDKRHNPLWKAGPSGDACRALWSFWQQVDSDTGELRHDFTDPSWNTRFLGDLYQDLSEAARKKYALLQTPDFVEEFILDRTLTPAIDTFGYREVRMIDPTCGSGHFLLGGFERIFRIWQNDEPGENPRVLAQKTLDAVCGVDLNPFAVAIARFRLLLAALQVCDIKQLKDTPDFHISLAVGDSLIHGARFDKEGQAEVIARQDMFGGDEAVFKDELGHFFDTEDSEELHRILGRQYHAVVGNPPYITVKDKALNLLYRARYDSCSGKYALSVPFMERFFDLALSGSGDGRELAGFTGQITSNSFMKREMGKKLIEEHIQHWDITHVIDTSGAHIPGHGTPTVILLGRNSQPSSAKVRAVLGINGEPTTPEDPSKGKVWNAILEQINNPGTESKYISVTDSIREKFHTHPWSTDGGGASELKSAIENSTTILKSHISSIGFMVIISEDDAFVAPQSSFKRRAIPSRPYLRGEDLRDWNKETEFDVIFPYLYSGVVSNLEISFTSTLGQHFWALRSTLRKRTMFGKTPEAHGNKWYSYMQMIPGRATAKRSLNFANVSTHNNFDFNRGGLVTNPHLPVITLPPEATEDDHLSLLSLLNSATACFWMKQIFQNKGVGGIGGGIGDEKWEPRYELDGTKMKQFPLPSESPLSIARELDHLASVSSEHSPDILTARDAVCAVDLVEAEQTTTKLRARMISLQEELDWQCYRYYGLIEFSDDLEWPEDRLDTLPPLTLGERAFEIRMARQMADGELETTWFERHKDAGSAPTAELPSHWPDDYRALVERRLTVIEKNKNINLIERPEYKRRWNTEPWDKRQAEALRKWLLARLEGYFFEGSRVCDLGDSFVPAAKGFTATNQPHLTTINQLADVVSSDAKWMEAAEVYHGSAGFDVSRLVKKLAEAECVPFLPIQRYKDSGLRKRENWESTWDLQRQEDLVEAKIRKDQPDLSEELLKEKIRSAQEKQVGTIPAPPKYKSTDFAKAPYWKMRGKLDVPKERWVSYLNCERVGDDSLVIAWAGWDHAQQAQALGAYYFDAKDNQGWSPERLKPLLVGLADLLPWLKQWHNDYNPDYGSGLGDYFAGLLETECHNLGTTTEAINKLRFHAPTQD